MAKILAKNKKGKVVGYIEPQKDGSFGYAFGSPSQKEVIMFYVDTLEQAKDRIAEHSYDDVIFESKKFVHKSLRKYERGNKIMRKSLKESFKAPKDWDLDDMLNDYGMEYLQENDSDNEPISMDDFNDYFNDCWEAVRSAFYGGRYGFKNDSFNPNDNYFRFNAYANVESIPYVEDYLKDIIDEEEFYDWCVDEGYFEDDEE